MKNTFLVCLVLFLSNSIKGQLQQQEIVLDKVEEIQISTFPEVSFNQSDKNVVVIEYDKALTNMIYHKKSGSKLSISLKLDEDLEWPDDKGVLRAKSRVLVYGDFGYLKNLALERVGKVKTDIKSENLFFRASGCGAIKGKIKTDVLNMEMSSSTIDIQGIAKDTEMVAKGSNCNFINFESQNMVISSESSNIKVNAKNSLNISRLGGSNLDYRGSPKVFIDNGINLKTSTINSK